MQLEQQTNYILSFADNLEIPALLKAVGIKHEEMEDDFFERIIRYVKIAVEVLSTKVFVFVNIRSYLTDEQIQELLRKSDLRRRNFCLWKVKKGLAWKEECGIL